MSKTKKRKALILIPIGVFTIAIIQVLAHFTEIPDFIRGAFTGIGIGLIVMALVVGKLKTDRN